MTDATHPTRLDRKWPRAFTMTGVTTTDPVVDSPDARYQDRPEGTDAPLAEGADDSAEQDPTPVIVEPFHMTSSTSVTKIGSESDHSVDEPSQDDELPPDRFGNRELSWLDFNGRVLALAEDRHQPLLERAKFLAIFASNLDEFYMVRVAGLKRRNDMGLAVLSADGLTVPEQLAVISARTQELVERQGRCFADDVLPALEEAGIRLARWDSIDPEDRDRLAQYFTEQIFPVLTPLAVDPAHPFPYISGLSLNMAILVRDPVSGSERFARLKVPNNVDRFIRVRRGVDDFLPIEDLIAAHLAELFPGMQVVEHQTFRVTRNADFEVEEDRDEDLLQALERELAQRRFGPPVRLEIADTTSERILGLLLSELDVDPADAVEVSGLLDLSCMWQLYALDRPTLKDPPFVPITPAAFAEGETPKSVFATLRDGDVLVHHPYESFATSVQRFIEQAAADPKVLAIKQTLYRTSGDSPIVDALISAAAAGKQVVVLVEIKARFDELANISWAKALERAGVHVVYGLVGLKTHCKLALVVRQDGPHIRRYAHVGTGNYNPKTARIYEDLGLLTCRPGDRRRPDRPVQRADRVLPADRVPATAGGPARYPDRDRRPDRAGDRAPAGRSRGPGPDEDELDGRRAGDRRAVPGVAGRGQDRHHGPRHLRAARRSARPEREHHRPLDRRSVPGALADHPLRRRRCGRRQHRRGVLDRQRRHDAPQPRPAGRGAGTGHRPHRGGAHRRAAHHAGRSGEPLPGS